jgi:hypothetical protein
VQIPSQLSVSANHYEAENQSNTQYCRAAKKGCSYPSKFKEESAR